MKNTEYYQNTRGTTNNSVPHVSLNESLFLSGLAFCTGVFLTVGIIQLM